MRRVLVREREADERFDSSQGGGRYLAGAGALLDLECAKKRKSKSRRGARISNSTIGNSGDGVRTAP